MGMGPDLQRFTPAVRHNLLAYLDGGLGEGEVRAIATKLTLSSTARREVEALQKTWELLKYLPRPKVSGAFTARTLIEVHQPAAADGSGRAGDGRRSARLRPRLSFSPRTGSGPTRPRVWPATCGGG
ncbi:MAG TPA: hypothetical protein VKP69_32060 [Isosphaeraceae bacterium]|nr:hypothetical protein [Isosphaeraceae bacterium]